MGKRKIYTERYEKAINHLKTNSDIEEQYLFEAKNCLTQIKKIKGAKGIAITSYFNDKKAPWKDRGLEYMFQSFYA